jgi:hypothetical protein
LALQDGSTQVYDLLLAAEFNPEFRNSLGIGADELGAMSVRPEGLSKRDPNKEALRLQIHRGNGRRHVNRLGAGC